jgi:hypothetical protein
MGDGFRARGPSFDALRMRSEVAARFFAPGVSLISIVAMLSFVAREVPA